MSVARATNWGFGACGGGGVPSGMLPMIRAVADGAVAVVEGCPTTVPGESWEWTATKHARVVRDTSRGIFFMGRLDL